MSPDLLVRGALVYPGDGAPSLRDVAVTGGRIEAVEPSLDAEAAEVVDEVRRVIADRVLTAVGVDGKDVPPALRFALRGWIGFVEATSVDWLATRSSRDALSKEALLQIWVSELASSLTIAQGIDPRVKVDLAG